MSWLSAQSDWWPDWPAMLWDAKAMSGTCPMLHVLLLSRTAEITSLQTKIFNNIAVKLHAWISNTPVHATFAWISVTNIRKSPSCNISINPSVMNCECLTFSCNWAQPKSHLYKQRSSTTSLSNFMPESATPPCMRHLHISHEHSKITVLQYL